MNSDRCSIHHAVKPVLNSCWRFVFSFDHFNVYSFPTHPRTFVLIFFLYQLYALSPPPPPPLSLSLSLCVLFVVVVVVACSFVCFVGWLVGGVFLLFFLLMVFVGLWCLGVFWLLFFFGGGGGGGGGKREERGVQYQKTSNTKEQYDLFICLQVRLHTFRHGQQHGSLQLVQVAVGLYCRVQRFGRGVPGELVVTQL